MLKHKLFFLIYGLLLVSFLTSCDQSSDFGSSSDVPAQFTCFSINDLTRAYDDTWQLGDKVGIYMIPSSSNHDLSKVSKVNYPYQVSANSTVATLTPVGETIFYPVDGSTVNFVAYYPYLNTATENYKAIYTFTTQNTKAAKEAVDFIFYRGTTNRSKTDATESMTFKHKFSKINITVKQGANGPSCDGLTMQLTGMPLSATVDLAALALDEASTTGLGVNTTNTTIATYTSSSDAISATVEAIVAPHSGTGNFTGRTFTFSTGGYTYDLPDNTTFEPGKVYTFNFTLTQTAAVLQEVKIDDWTGGEVQWNKDYALTTSTGTLELTHIAQPITIRYKGTTTIPGITSSTSVTNSTAGTPSWFSTSLGEASTDGDWKVQTLTVTPIGDAGVVDRRGFIHVTLEGLSVVITVRQKLKGIYEATDGLANCYIVYPGASVAIPINRAWSYGGGSFTSTYYAEVLWDDTSGLVVSGAEIKGGGSSQHILINTNSGKAGNALVAVREGSTTGPIRWSYYIWVTDFNPYQNTYTNAYTYNGDQYSFTFMDRNLGATFAGLGSGAGTGLFYQWGRKDPLPATGGAATNAAVGAGTWYQTATNATLGTIANTIANPHTRYWGVGASSYDWLFAARDTELWGHSGGKTIYDPCPEGWRVPKNHDPSTGYASNEASPWAGLAASNCVYFNAASGGPGIVWNGELFFPLTGCRD